jgi:hypothetical protein
MRVAASLTYFCRNDGTTTLLWHNKHDRESMPPAALPEHVFPLSERATLVLAGLAGRACNLIVPAGTLRGFPVGPPVLHSSGLLIEHWPSEQGLTRRAGSKFVYIAARHPRTPPFRDYHLHAFAIFPRPPIGLLRRVIGTNSSLGPAAGIHIWTGWRRVSTIEVYCEPVRAPWLNEHDTAAVVQLDRRIVLVASDRAPPIAIELTAYRPELVIQSADLARPEDRSFEALQRRVVYE